jgi:hypothetical protein
MKYCKICRLWVKPRREFNMMWFLLIWFIIMWLLAWMALLGVGAIIYLIYYAVKPKVCPICGQKRWALEAEIDGGRIGIETNKNDLQ